MAVLILRFCAGSTTTRTIAARTSSVQTLRLRCRALATTASSLSSQIPVVDFAPFLSRSSTAAEEEARRETSSKLVDAFKRVGFVYLSNHGIPLQQIDRVFADSKRFFERPMEDKMAMAWESPESNRGYSAPGREKVTQLSDARVISELREQNPDLKESLEIGKEPSRDFQNNWPKGDPQFRRTMMSFFDTAHELHMQVMRSIAMGLELEEHFFDKFIDKKDHNMRILHYPEVAASVLDRPGQVRAGAHSDYGSITLLFQDSRGGLEVRTPENSWVPATPIPGTVVINAGDLLARWSRDVIKSTDHRVVAPPVRSGETYPARYSIAFFCNPNMDCMIEGLPIKGGLATYPPVNTKEYMVKRLSETY